MANKITYGIGFNVDKASLASIKTELEKIKTMTAKDYMKIRPEVDASQARAEIIDLKESISQIESAFAKSFNVNLGSTNVTTLSKELKNLDIGKISSQFASLGSSGVQAWQSITSAVLGSNLQLQKTQTVLDRMATTMGNTIKWGISSSVMNSFTGSVQKAYGYVKNLDKSLNDIRIVAGQSAEQMADFAAQANKAASALGATTLDYTNASLIFYQQGLSGDAVAERTDAVIKMTNVTGESADKVSSYMTAIWNNFADGSQQLEYYADVMTALGAATASSTEEIADGLEKFASVADTVGLSYEYATAALATVVSETRQSADVVGTAFRTLFARIQGLSLGETLDDGTTLNKYSEALASVGIDIKEQNGELKEMDDILDELGSKWKTLSSDTQVALAQTVAGVRQYNQMIALMENWDEVQKNISLAANSAGTLQEQQDTYMESLEGHLNQLATAQESLYSSLFDSDSFKDILDILTSLVEGMADFVDAIGGGGNALLLLGTVATKVFDKQIAQGLTNIINNSKIAATNMENLKAQQEVLEKTKAQAEKNTSTSAGQAMFKGSEVAVDEHSRMMDYTSILSPEQIEQGNQLIQIYSDLTAKTEELKLKQQEAAQFMQVVLQNQNPEEYGNVKTEEFQEAVGIGESADLVGEFNSAIDKTKESTDLLTKSAKATFKEYQKGGTVATEVEEDLQKKAIELQKALKQIAPILSKDLQKKFKDLEDIEIYFKADDFEKNCNDIINIGDKAFAELEARSKVVGDAVVNANQSSMEVTEAQTKAAKDSLDSYFANLDLSSTIKGIADVTSAIGGLFTAWNAMQGLGSIWSNDDLTLAEKFAQTILLTSTLMTSLVPIVKTAQMTYQAFTLVKTAFLTLEKKENAETALNTILETKNTAGKAARWVMSKLLEKELTKETAAEIASTAATGANTIAQSGNNIVKAVSNALHGDFSGLALVAIGAIALGTTALIANTSAQEKDNAELERANQLETDLADTNNELTESYNNLKDSFGAYDTAVDKLDSCIKGTQEWKEALQEVNDAAVDVINNLPDNVDVSGLYHRDKQTGQIVIDEEKMEGVLDTSQMQAAASDFAVAAGSYQATLTRTENSMDDLGNSMSKNTFGLGEALSFTTSGLAGLGIANEIESEFIEQKLLANLEDFSDSMTNNEFREKMKEFGVDLDSLSDNELEKYRKELMDCANATNAAAEKMRLVAGLKVDEILGDDYGAAEKAITTEELTAEQQDIYEQIMKDQADKMAKSSDSDNDYYQDLAARLEKATGGQYRATKGNTVRHTDEDRTLVFEDESGEQTEEKSIEWVAQTIAAYEAMEKVGANAEEAKKSLDGLEDFLGEKFGQDVGESISSGFKDFVTTGNLESMTQEDYEKLAGLDKDELMKAMGLNKWNSDDVAQFDQMFGEYGYEGFKSAIDDYGTALDSFTEGLLPNVQEAFNAIDDTEGLSVVGQKAIAQALQDAMVYGGQESVDALKNMFTDMSKEDLSKFGEVISSISDWGGTSVAEFEKMLEDAGVTTDLTTEQLDEYIKVMRDANNVTMDFNSLSTQYAETMKIASGLEAGSTISQEDYDKLGVAAEGYFTKMLDGTYKLTKDASDFYDAVKEEQIKNFKDSLEQQRNNLVTLKKADSQGYNIEELSKAQGNVNRIGDTFYDVGNFVGWNETSREDLSLQQKQDKNLSWENTEGLEQQIALLEMLGDTEQALQWKTAAMNGELTDSDYTEIAEQVKGLADTYGSLDAAIEAATGTYIENMISLFSSAEDFDEMREMMADEQFATNPSAIQAFTTAYNQMWEAQRMDDLDVEEMEDYAGHLQNLADESELLADTLADDEEASENLATQVMNMTKGVEKLADGWEDWSDVLKNSSKESEEYSKTLAETKDALSDLLDIEESYISEDFVVDHMDDIAKAAEGDAEAIDRLRDASLESVIISIDFKDENIKTQFTDTITALKAFADGQNLDVGGKVSLDDSAYLTTLQNMMAAGQITAADVNASLSAIGYTPVYEEQEVPITQVTPTTTTHHERTDIKFDDDGNMIAWTDREWTEKNNPTVNEGSQTVTAWGTEENPPTIKVQKLTGMQKSAGGSFNNFSSANKGGGSSKGGGDNKPKKKDKIDDEADRYHKVDTQITKTENKLSKLQSQSDKFFGSDKINNLNQQWDLLNQQVENYNEKLKIAEQEQSELRSQLAGQGVQFNADGTIANYMEAFQAQEDYVNRLIDQYNSLSKEQQEAWDEAGTIEKAEEQFEAFKENMDRYDELVSDFIPGLQESIQDAIDEQIEIQIEKFNMEMEIRLDLSEAEREWNEFKSRIIDGIKEEDILGNAQARLQDFSSYYKTDGTGIIQANTDHVNDILAQLTQMDSTGWSDVYGDNRIQALGDLQTYYQQLMSDMTDLQDLADEIHQSYMDMMDEAQEKFDEQIEAYETIGSLIEHDMNVISLVYGEESYGALSQYYGKQEENNNKALDFQRQQVEFWRQQMDALEEGSEEWESAKEKWMSAVDEWNAKVEESIENLQDKYLNAINLIFQNLNDNVTSGLGLEYVSEEWDLINQNADKYLDTINSLYETQALENKYLDAIDQTDNVSAQQKLKKLMDQEITALREKDKLTQYDIERANMKYEIALKQIALEEAQQNKSNMRLRRDSQGNYSYQFVADDEGVADAEQELSDLYNSLYNFDKENYQSNLDELYSVWEEFQGKMAEAAQINDPEAREARELLLKEQYGELINGIVAENEVIRTNLYDSAFTDLADLYNVDVENFQQMADAEKEILMSDLLPYWDSGIQHMADTFAGEDGFLGVCQDAFEQLDQATKDYEEGLIEIQDNAGQSFEEIKEGVDETITSTEQLITDNDALIESYGRELDAVNAVIEQLDGLIDKYKKAEEAAKAATEAAYKYWQQENQKAANDAGDNKAPTTGGTNGGNTNTNTNPTPTNSGSNQNSLGTASNGAPIIAEYTIKSGDTLWGIGSKYGVSWSRIYTENQSVIGSNPNLIHPGKKLKIPKYDTGGYTGEWSGNSGQLAMLHEKELVLNANDTRNMLNAMEILRDITIGNSIFSRLAAVGANSSLIGGGFGDTLEQNVHIDASFPNVTNSHEIEDAINNLMNVATQRINRR